MSLGSTSSNIVMILRLDIRGVPPSAQGRYYEETQKTLDKRLEKSPWVWFIIGVEDETSFTFVNLDRMELCRA